MKTRFVSVDRDQPLSLPPDLRDWIPQDDLVHFVIQAVEGMDLPSLKVSVKASGSAQYPPHMMLDLLIYCYANGVSSSRRHDRAFKIERATHRIEARAKAKAHKEQAEYEPKVKAREQRKGRAKGCEIKKLDPRPGPNDQDNLADTDSRLMRHNKHSAYEQAYNAKACVDADGSQLVLSTHVTQCASDKKRERRMATRHPGLQHETALADAKRPKPRNLNRSPTAQTGARPKNALRHRKTQRGFAVDAEKKGSGHLVHKFPTTKSDRLLWLEKHRFRCGYVDNFASAPG